MADRLVVVQSVSAEPPLRSSFGSRVAWCSPVVVLVVAAGNFAAPVRGLVLPQVQARALARVQAKKRQLRASWTSSPLWPRWVGRLGATVAPRIVALASPPLEGAVVAAPALDESRMLRRTGLQQLVECRTEGRMPSRLECTATRHPKGSPSLVWRSTLGLQRPSARKRASSRSFVRGACTQNFVRGR